MSLSMLRNLVTRRSSQLRFHLKGTIPPPRNQLLLEHLEERCLLAVFTVTNTNDAGPGTLRQAILDANANPGLDAITFAIGDGGVQTIHPSAVLPTVTDSVILDGITQPGFTDHPLIVLDGSQTGIDAGLVLNAGGCTVRGLVLDGFSRGVGRGVGLELSGSGGDLITGNYFGTDVTGTQAVGNGTGILCASAHNTIGGTAPGMGNLISGNLSAGLRLGSDTIVQGNWIGTDRTGSQALGNGVGISVSDFSSVSMAMGNLIGGTAPGARNVISGNVGNGIVLTGLDLAPAPAAGVAETIQGNYIGIDATGSYAVPNSTGIFISPGRIGPISGIQIGGTDPGAGNVISGNRVSGVFIRYSGDNVVQGNLIGTDRTGMRAVPNQSYGLDLTGAANNLIGGTPTAARNLISGNGVAGVHLSAGGPFLEGNWIGTDSTGNPVLGNGTGVRVDASGFAVGGSEAGAGNLIAGNTYGVYLAGDDNQVQGNVISGNTYGVFVAGNDNRIQDNRIGTNAAGTAAMPNGNGVYLLNGSGNLIGGMDPEAGNLISGNLTGILIFSGQGNTVQGNRVGTDASGLRAVGNGDGVALNGPGNWIGGTAPGAGNLISGNLQAGVSIASWDNLVQGNLLGTDLTGTALLGNENGIFIGTGAEHNTIGGTESGARNLISGNRNAGMFVAGQSNLVQGNRIGTDATGTLALGNLLNGVDIEGASDNTIGGTTPQARNLISGNLSGFVVGDGILISSGQRNLVEGNFIGTDCSGTCALPNNDGVRIVGGQDNEIGGTDPGAGNLISGNSPPHTESGAGVVVADSRGNRIEGNRIGTDITGSQALGNWTGISVSGQDNSVGGTAPGAGNLVSGNLGSGIAPEGGGTRVQGNEIGTDATGTSALGNRWGILLDRFSADTLIGGTEPGARNVISGNAIGISGGFSVIVQGNFIGTDGTGRFAVGNDRGIELVDANDNLIGGTSPGAGNLISGNRVSGVHLDRASGNRLEGNWIGTAATGTLALPNGVGVFVESTLPNIIGGTKPGAGNLISGNTGAGLQFNILGVDQGQLVQGNWIGTDFTGSQALPNAQGIAILFGSNITIGGTSLGAGNLISGNTNDGISIAGGANDLVQGNRIGVDSTGTQPLGNGGNGVVFTGEFTPPASNNLVGGTTGGAANTIAYNGQDGVRVVRGSHDAIHQNAIFANGGLGIDLVARGNQFQAAPVLMAATASGDLITIQGTLTSTPNTTFTIELFANTACDPSGFGEGERFLASLTVATDATGAASFTVILAVPVEIGQFITATATDVRGSQKGNTSAFSNCVAVTAGDLPNPPAGGSVFATWQPEPRSADLAAAPIVTLSPPDPRQERYFLAFDEQWQRAGEPSRARPAPLDALLWRAALLDSFGSDCNAPSLPLWT